MLRGYSFRPRGWALALAALACAAFISLGHWQSRRADAKRAAALELERAERAAPIELAPGALDAAALVHKRVAARGVFVAERTLLLNRLRRARPGYEVITPLRFSQSQWHVLVNRGWRAAAAAAARRARGGRAAAAPARRGAAGPCGGEGGARPRRAGAAPAPPPAEPIGGGGGAPRAGEGAGG